MHQPETSGRFDGSFLCAETDTFYQRSRKFQPFTDYWDGATQKNSPSCDEEFRTFIPWFAASDYYAWRLSNEAPTKALIKRCGRVGREINSGWNWQPTKNLFSGDAPEKTIPFA